MYVAHFGLNSRPFGAKAEGPAVFTGPQQTKVVKGLHKGLMAQDAVVTVSGPIGVGKTTNVAKALETINPNRMAAWIGRMNLEPNELLDLLLAGFGVGNKVQGSIRRFALFRRVMAERAAAGAAVAVVVEDAKRLGVDTLAELEALTAADTGDAIGANIILMGPPDLGQFLKDPALARLKQRVRRRETVAEFSQAEVTGYLKHCIRQAGGDYDAIFEQGVDQIVYGCSDGVPRVINTLCENVLEAAAESGLQRITTGLMHEVASDNYTYEGPPPDLSSDADVDWEAPAVAKDDGMPAEEDLPPAARNIVVESGRYPELPETAAEPEPTPAIATQSAPAEALAAEPEPMPAPAPEPVPELETEPEPEPQPEPLLEQEPAPEPEPLAEAESVPELEPEPIPEPAVQSKPARQVPPDAPSMPTPTAEDGIEIPELINDTQPELSTLSPAVDREASSSEPEKEDTGTEIQEKPPGIEAFAAKAAADASAEDKSGADDADFDLDAALSVEVEETNIMEGLTPNLDSIAADVREPEPEAAPAAKDVKPAVADLPTLSNSMRVDVQKEVAKARQAEPAETDEPKAVSPERRNASGQASVAGAEKPGASVTVAPTKPVQAASPAAEKPAANAPVQQVKPAAAAPAEAEKPKPRTPTPPKTPESAAPARETKPAKAAPTPLQAPAPAPIQETEPETGTETLAVLEPEPELVAAMEAATDMDPSAEEPVKPDNSSAHGESEMTRRIAALDAAERKSDVDSLEAALDAAKKGNRDDLVMAPPVARGDGAARPDTNEAVADAVPEITLDKKLTDTQKKRKDELHEAATQISKAISLDEFSDKMAETLFGNEDLNAIAAEVVANPPPDHEASESSPDHEKAEAPPDGPSPVLLDESAAMELSLAEDPDSVAEAAAPAANGANQPAEGTGGLRESQAMRADILQSLKQANDALDHPVVEEKVELAHEPSLPDSPAPNGPQPDSIEDQIDTVMTQTLAALDLSQIQPDDLEPDEEKPAKKSGGFFSRFRRSS